MSKEKNIIVQRTTKGITENIRLGDLSKNELCRVFVQINQENNNLKTVLNNAYLTYANHIASQDGMSKNEWLEWVNGTM